jgi:hypothetical protein
MSETIKVSAKVVDAKYNVATKEIILSLDVGGKKKAARLPSSSLIKFETEPDTEVEIMIDYARAFKNRKHPITIETTEDMLDSEEDLPL